ncbi:gfo/Idh/MocA family oxidoreductase [Desertihabitans brevis]|uniref:Gfo/Idh/MocA family oxidoreductase n=1 Tax=Desertihabitans brevis TaxID=2268447 RepID=A0A367YWM7_9ACTN|nr:Gfo/Idh/MocA family oxidoreductase [Desertihabitans brevis]RCK69351.1 gfo/Idh/MocA family oxidoreductase [Desertihabitans brevis]
MAAQGRVRVAVVGAGIRGSMFARALQQNPDAELVAVCEPVERTRAAAAAALGVPVCADVEELLTRFADELTAVVVATPDFAHRDVAVRCAEAGLHLLVEKPLATTVEDAEAITLASERAGVHAVVGFENRWNERFAEVRAQLAGGGQGRVVHQVANLNDTVFVPTQMLSWAGASSPAWFLMPHTLDLTMWLSDAVPVDVFARGVKRVLPGRGVPTWDVVTASFAMSDGSVVVLNSSWVLPTSMPSVFDFRYEVHTDTTSYTVDISPSGVTRYDAERASWLQFGVHERAGRLRGVPIDMVDDFVALLGGADLDLPGARHGLLVTRSIVAVHESLETGRPVPIGSGPAGPDAADAAPADPQSIPA